MTKTESDIWFMKEILTGLQSIDKNLDLIRKALEAKKKKNAKR